MSEEKCPRCGHEKTVSGIALDGVDHWNCGAYREPSGNIYESELCETRQEKRIACEQLEALSEDYAKMQERAEKAEAELAKLQNTYNGMRARHSLELSVIEAFLFDDHDEDGDLNGLPNQWYDYETMVSSKAQMVVIERNQIEAELAKREKALESLESIAEGAWLEPHSDGRMMIGTGMGLGCFADDAPELADWLRNREK